MRRDYVLDTEKQVGRVQAKKERIGRLPAEMSRAEINQLFAECLPQMRNVARRLFRNEEDAEDALQDALLLAFRKLHQFQGRSSFSTWLHSIVRNTSYVCYRRRSAHPTVSTEQFNDGGADFAEERPFIDGHPTPEESYAQKERSEIFREATGELPEKYQPAVYLFYTRGLGEEATARTLGITLGALKSQLHRSRVLLLWKIWKRCLPEAKRTVFWQRLPPHARSWVQSRKSHCKSQWEVGMLS
jgi:RNA polymerase sigma-70 factor (ECF subfamily)